MFVKLQQSKNKIVLQPAILLSIEILKYIYFQIENYGELIGWKATDNFDIILKTDYDNLTKLVYYFSKHNVDINHDLQLLKLESKQKRYSFVFHFEISILFQQSKWKDIRSN